MTTSVEDCENGAIQISGLSNNVNMAGISLAIFTFLLFFSSAQVHSLLFQAALGLIVGAVFSFSIAGLYSFVLIFSAPAKHANLQSHRQRAELFFALGLSILLLEPGPILFALGFAVVASVALIFFLAYMAIYLYETKTVHSIRGHWGWKSLGDRSTLPLRRSLRGPPYGLQAPRACRLARRSA